MASIEVLITGVTGVVGPAIAASLLQQEEDATLYYLIRPGKDGEDPHKRLEKSLGNVRRGKDIVLPGDVTKPLCGVDPTVISVLRGRIRSIVHCAASIKFSRAHGQEIWTTNLGGAKNVSALAKALEIPDFYYVSTAYVAGNARVMREIDNSRGQSFRNSYEESKLAAEERLVREWGTNLSRMRLGIVTGDSDTGSIPDFSGYYNFFAPFWSVLSSMREGWGQPESRSMLQSQGIEFDAEGRLVLPIYIDASQTSRLSLTHRDWTARTIAALIKRGPCGHAYHLVPETPPFVKWVIEESFAHLGITGYQLREHPATMRSALLGNIQAGIDSGIGQYHGYITHEARFDQRNLREDLGSDFQPHPEISGEYLRMILNYAIKKGFRGT